MDERQVVKLTLKGENADHTRAWEILQNRNMEEYPTPTDFVVPAIIRFTGEESCTEKEQAKPTEQADADRQKWANYMLDEMEKRFRAILRGPVGR